MKQFRILLVVASMIILTGCGGSAGQTSAEAPAATVGDVRITGPWVRATSMGGGEAATSTSDTAAMDDVKMGAAYMVIASSGGADTLLGASTDAAKTVELHTVVDQNGVMQMRPVEGGIQIPANGKVELKPGGYHVMLIGLTKDLQAGDSVDLTLQFEKAGKATVKAQVRSQ